MYINYANNYMKKEALSGFEPVIFDLLLLVQLTVEIA